MFYPSEYLKGGVRIIDTPGVGSVYSHNTDAALAYLPHVDAGIFIVSADPPLSGSEHQFLKDVRAYASKLFFLLNKIDQVDEKERQESLEFTRGILEQDLGVGRVRIQPMAARVALEAKKNNDETELRRSLLPDVEKQLKAFLVHEKGAVFLKAATNGLLRIVADEIISVQLEQKALGLPIEELNVKRSRFEEELKTIQKDRQNNGYLLDGSLKTITEQLDEEIRIFQKEKYKTLHEELEAKYTKKTQEKTENLGEELERFIFDSITDVFSTWRLQQAERISTQLEETHQDFADKANQTIERIHALASNVFDLKLEPFTSVDKLSQKSDFYFLLKDDPLSMEMICLAVTSILPRFIAKKIIINRMKATTGNLLDRHCGRVRYDLISRAKDTVQEFRYALDEKIDLTIEGIRSSLQNAITLNQKSKIEVEKNTALLAQKIQTLSDIREELRARLACIEESSIYNSNNMS